MSDEKDQFLFAITSITIIILQSLLDYHPNYILILAYVNAVQVVRPHSFVLLSTLGALLRYLKRQGADTVSLMIKIEDIIIKAMLAVAPQIGQATRSYCTHTECCFELFGFDVFEFYFCDFYGFLVM